MKIIFLALLNLLIVHTLAAQEKPKVVLPAGKDHLASFDLHLPVGAFAHSHFSGAGLSYSWSHHRFGYMVFPSKLLGFTVNAGGDYYFGRKVETAAHPFRYGGYIYTYLLAGIITNPRNDINISLTAGPTLGIYKGNTDMGGGVNLFGNYFFESNMSLGTGVTYKKHPDTDAFWTWTLRYSYVFGAK